MKQQCNVLYVYGSVLILICGFFYFIVQGNVFQAIFWVLAIIIALWLYVRYFPRISQLMGYGSVTDKEAKEIHSTNVKVTLYTGYGCPFCPIVKMRLKTLQQKMGFELMEEDITINPNLLIKKGIRSVPVIEIGETCWIGNATSEQIEAFIANNTRSKKDVEKIDG